MILVLIAGVSLIIYAVWHYWYILAQEKKCKADQLHFTTISWGGDLGPLKIKKGGLDESRQVN